MNATETFRSPESINLIDLEKLVDYLAGRGYLFNRLSEPRQFAGGLSNWNYLIEVDGRPYVLRRPPAGPLPPGAYDMAREHKILSHLNQSFPLAPASPLFCDDPAVIGAPFLLIEYRSGVVVRDKLPEGVAELPSERSTLSHAALQVLVDLHQVDPYAIGLGTLGKPDGMVQRQSVNWSKRAAIAFGDAMPRTLTEVAAWLAQPAPVSRKVAMLHSDFKFDNLIFDARTLKPAAIIDWDMGTLGDPLFDVATLLSYWTEPNDPPVMHQLQQMPTGLPGFPGRQEILHRYAELTGTDISAFKYYRILALFKLCVVFRQLYARHARGELVPPRYASFGPLADGLSDFTLHALQSEKF